MGSRLCECMRKDNSARKGRERGRKRKRGKWWSEKGRNNTIREGDLQPHVKKL